MAIKLCVGLRDSTYGTTRAISGSSWKTGAVSLATTGCGVSLAGSKDARCVRTGNTCIDTAGSPPMFAKRLNHSAEYKAHLRSKEWRQIIRPAALERAGYKCAFCGLGVKKLRSLGRHLEVHHNNYLRLGHEEPEDLTVLCAGAPGSCHTIADNQRRAATGRKPPLKRKRSRRRRRGGPLREMRRIFVVLGSAYGGLWLASIVLPHVS